MEKTTPQAASPKPASPKPSSAPKEVTMRPDGVLHIRVSLPDGREVDHVARAGHDGTVVITVAPEPAAPVQDPDPISGT